MTASEETAELDTEQEQTEAEDVAALVEGLTPNEVGGYVREMVHGMRRLTQRLDQRDVRFLNYLLAIVEEEARKIADNSYH
jgi:hypothetical protein